MEPCKNQARPRLSVSHLSKKCTFDRTNVPCHIEHQCYDGTGAKSPFFCFSTEVSEINPTRPPCYVFDPSTRAKHRFLVRSSLPPPSGRGSTAHFCLPGSHHRSLPPIVTRESSLSRRALSDFLFLPHHSLLITSLSVFRSRGEGRKSHRKRAFSGREASAPVLERPSI